MVGLHKRLGWSRARTEAIQRYLGSHGVPKLHLGAGTNVLEGWFNTDLSPSSPEVFFLDSTLRFPFEDATFRYVFSEHHIEHLDYEEGLFTLRECLRVLAPGGVLRLATPSLETLADLVAAEPTGPQERYIRFMSERFIDLRSPPNAAGVVNNAFKNWGHRFLYDRPTLLSSLREAGFVKPSFVSPGESGQGFLRGIEGHGRFIGDEDINRFETMVVEARRP